MDAHVSARAPVSGTPTQRMCAHLVHAYTASGVGFAFLAAMELCSAQPDVRRFFAFLFGAVMIDATDGPLARRYHVKRWAAKIDGRTIDDIVDYLTFTFLPLLLIWRMDWLAQPSAVWIIFALITSLFGFSNSGAKDEAGGFFLGFPSYWNIVAFYIGLAPAALGTWGNALLVLLLALLTVMPVRFIYPNLAPRPWKLPLMIGAGVWLVMLLVLLIDYRHPPLWLVWLSLLYPVFYTALSLWLDKRTRRGPVV